MGCEASVLVNLGSNSGDRRQNLSQGIAFLNTIGLNGQRISPCVESPAQLPNGVPYHWNKPFLNLNVNGTTTLNAETFYQKSKKLQMQVGGERRSKWAPRALDIDIIVWGDTTKTISGKNYPPADACQRPYIISPLVHLDPGFRFPDPVSESSFQISCSENVEYHIPLWMGIVNVTPDSFSDGGRILDLNALRVNVENMIAHGVHIIDIGAESTRPGATPLDSSSEWNRLQGAIELVMDLVHHQPLKPTISIDTYHPETAEKALQMGVGMINDVSGLGSQQMINLARDSDREFVAMHSVTVPADPASNVSLDEDVCDVFLKWVKERQELWQKSGLNLDRIIIDPGIGFGKNSLQSMQLMRSIESIREQSGQRVLIGHSRKRHLRSITNSESSRLDAETIGASLNLCNKRVDIFRVHDIEGHARAYLSWLHLNHNQV